MLMAHHAFLLLQASELEDLRAQLSKSDANSQQAKDALSKAQQELKYVDCKMYPLIHLLPRIYLFP